VRCVCGGTMDSFDTSKSMERQLEKNTWDDMSFCRDCVRAKSLNIIGR